MGWSRVTRDGEFVEIDHDESISSTLEWKEDLQAILDPLKAAAEKVARPIDESRLAPIDGET